MKIHKTEKEYEVWFDGINEELKGRYKYEHIAKAQDETAFWPLRYKETEQKVKKLHNDPNHYELQNGYIKEILLKPKFSLSSNNKYKSYSFRDNTIEPKDDEDLEIEYYQTYNGDTYIYEPLKIEL